MNLLLKMLKNKLYALSLIWMTTMLAINFVKVSFTQIFFSSLTNLSFVYNLVSSLPHKPVIISSSSLTVNYYMSSSMTNKGWFGITEQMVDLHFYFSG